MAIPVFADAYTGIATFYFILRVQRAQYSFSYFGIVLLRCNLSKGYISNGVLLQLNEQN